MAKYIAGTGRDKFGIALCAALGIDHGLVRRIIVDLKTGSAARVYYETYADDEKLAVAFDAEMGIRLVSEEAARYHEGIGRIQEATRPTVANSEDAV